MCDPYNIDAESFAPISLYIMPYDTRSNIWIFSDRGPFFTSVH